LHANRGKRPPGDGGHRVSNLGANPAGDVGSPDRAGGPRFQNKSPSGSWPKRGERGGGTKGRALGGAGGPGARGGPPSVPLTDPKTQKLETREKGPIRVLKDSGTERSIPKKIGHPPQKSGGGGGTVSKGPDGVGQKQVGGAEGGPGFGKKSPRGQGPNTRRYSCSVVEGWAISPRRSPKRCQKPGHPKRAGPTQLRSGEQKGEFPDGRLPRGWQVTPWFQGLVGTRKIGPNTFFCFFDFSPRGGAGRPTSGGGRGGRDELKGGGNSWDLEGTGFD